MRSLYWRKTGRTITMLLRTKPLAVVANSSLVNLPLKYYTIFSKFCQKIAIVGPSGDGKSTIASLLLRFYNINEGEILIDDKNIYEYDLENLRGNMSIVPQDVILFGGTIRENIAYGKPNASRDDVMAAARAAHAHEFILRLSHGYDSLVGERGQSLSGGERQRISIARALLIDPQILILDEATSSVDSTTEKEIQKALDNLVKGRTTIAIAHRLSTLRKADRLVVLDKGQVVEEGSHEQLMSLQGVYRRMYDTQARQAMDAVDAELGVTHA